MFNRTLICAFLLSLTGCITVGPDYKPPQVTTPAAWRVEEREARDFANTAWWEQFNDPVLNGLVRTALAENSDLLIATARIEEFFGRWFRTRGDQYPSSDASGDAFRQRLSDQGATRVDGSKNPYNQYEALLNAGWEIDFWGKFRRATEAARAELLATEEGRRTVVLTLVSSVASSYVDLRSLDKQLVITQGTADSRKATLDLFQQRFDNGIISEVDLSQAESEYEDARARIPDIEREIGQTENALSVLVGRLPGPIPRGRSIDELLLPAVPAGVPSDLLERRPDIRQSEQLMVAANAQIGVAKSLYFPTVSLTGAFGTVSTDLSNLLTSSARTWNFGVPVSVPLLTFGRIGGEVAAAEAAQRQALYSYQLTIQNAFREVEDALIDRSKSGQRLDALSRQLKALRNYSRLARMRYDEGYTSYLEVLDAERSLFNVELLHTTGQNTLFRSVVNIYKSMGGGWVTTAAEGLPTQPVMEAGFIP
jgi:multidrug efflux system outer membrane protein